ncbi:hypothetical protein ACIPYS_08070 [Kitasatospora sp. NPDC089913]|uniref:hypothetical protein n=1 Tax=Kitasatospora sp. NPDC089913 TaxID=3364080 RepID=UPI003830504E
MSGRGRAEVELDLPDPARPVLVTVETEVTARIGLRAAGPGPAGRHDATEGRGHAALLLSPERQRAVRRVTVDSTARWTLRIHAPDSVDEFTAHTRGSGPRILEHRRGTARAAASQIEDTSGILRVVRYPDGPDGPPTVVVDELRSAVGGTPWAGFVLDRPQFVVVECGSFWFLDIAPTDGLASTPLVRHGFDRTTEYFDRPHPGEPAVLELVAEFGSCHMTVIDGTGRELGRHWVSADAAPVLVPLWAGPEDAALDRLGVRVEYGRAAWRLVLRPDEPSRSLTGPTEGSGDELLRYDGPPAVLHVRLPTGQRRPLTVETGYGAVRSRRGQERCGALLVGAAGHPEVVTVRAEGGWLLEPAPLDGLRAFDERLTGRGSEVVRWTGTRDRLVVRGRSGLPRPPWYAAVSTTSWPGLLPDGPTGALLLVVRDPRHRGWRLTAR